MRLFQRPLHLRVLGAIDCGCRHDRWRSRFCFKKHSMSPLRRYFREHASRYAQAETLHADASRRSPISSSQS